MERCGKGGGTYGTFNGRIQEAVHTVEQWANQWGLEFSAEKKIVIFTRKRVLPKFSVFRFLGVMCN